MQTPSDSETEAMGAAAKSLQDAINSAMARGFIYRYLAMAFEYPSAEQWLWLTDTKVHGLLAGALSFAGGEAATTAATPAMLKAFTSENYRAHVEDYVALFGHAARGSCPVNEIEYGDLKADPLFQPHRLADLAAFYHAFGMDVGEDAKERQDHICIEFEFMSVLAVKEAFAFEHQLEDEQVASCRDAQKKFLREHLGRWVPAFCRRLARAASASSTEALAVMTRRFIVDECHRFDVVPGSEDLLLRPVDESESLCSSCGITSLPPGALATT